MKSKTIAQIHEMIENCNFATDDNFSNFSESNNSEIKECHRLVKNIPKLTQNYMFFSELQLFIKENVNGVSFKEDQSIIKTIVHDKLGEFCIFNNESITIGDFNIKYSEDNFEDLVISVINDFIKYSLLKEQINNLSLGKKLNKQILDLLYNVHLNTEFGQPDKINVIYPNKKMLNINFEKIVIFWNETFSARINFFPESDEVYYEYFDAFGTNKKYSGSCLIEQIPVEFWNYIQSK